MLVKNLYQTPIPVYVYVILLTFISSCGLLGSDDNKKPEPPLEPGSRNYTWTVDTLSSPPDLFYMNSLWGDSPTNVWAVGPADESVNSMWHYDGQHWKKTTQRLSSSLQSIHGFGPTNVWACNSPGGNIFHYDGTSWTNTGTYSYPGYSITYLNNIWGPASDEIYIAGGAYDQEKGSLAILAKYDGRKWNYIDLPDKEMSFVWARKSKKNNQLYISAIKFLPTGDVFKIFTYNGNALKEIYSGSEVTNAWEVAGSIYVSIRKRVYKHQNGKLELWKDFSQTTYLGNISGRNEKDFFVEASDGLAHYNGTDLKTIYPTDLSISHIFVMEKDVFAIGDFRVIIHGTLNEE